MQCYLITVTPTLLQSTNTYTIGKYTTNQKEKEIGEQYLIGDSTKSK